ncbi:uncharacterized protein LOC142983614 [Anticarsia gemmatalis]|uniref:uncharacterized protein LOC142983614 n=1 Tax=Anticarsia gemmatalis TaxID=129554 RepID=UPI003F76ACE1
MVLKKSGSIQGIFLIIYLVYFTIINVCNCQRRIINGRMVKGDKKYVVYLVQAAHDTQEYDYWLCGGAIVSPSYILTSAACVEDIKYLYAIAGYRKYVNNDKLGNDDCIQKTKKKIVYICVPKAYKLNYKKVVEWAYIDIALAKVESPYGTNDDVFKKYCDYAPQPIAINYQQKLQEPGTDVIVMGWGHKKKWRKANDKSNYNQLCLRYASTKIISKSICKEEYAGIKNMGSVIDEYMICTNGKGDLNEVGDVRGPNKLINGCTRKDFILGNCSGELDGRRHNDVDKHSVTINGKTYYYGTDEYFSLKNGKIVIRKKKDHSIVREITLGGESRESIGTGSKERPGGEESRESSTKQTIRSTTQNIEDTEEISNENAEFEGICQNDHGGPIVTWAGAREQVIGVASVFRVDMHSECTGPFLYTSTQCNGKFLNCILNAEDQRARRIFQCDKSPEERGFATFDKVISWKNHPDGPAFGE